MNNLIDTVITLAQGEIGVRESGGINRGRRVDEYQRADTLGGVGYAWCSSFTSWLLKQAASKLDRKIDYCYSASCDVVLAWARSESVLRDKPQVGDFFLCMASKHDATHIGLVIGVDSSSFTTIEGNTNLSGGREGIGVFKRRRPLSSRYKFVRWIDAQPQVKAVVTETWHALIKDKQVPLIKRGASFWAPSRKWGEALGLEVVWNPETQSVFFGGREVPSQVAWVGGATYLPVQTLAAFSNSALFSDNAKQLIRVGA